MGERTNVEMAIKHNQKLLKNHFRKDWQRYVRVHFDQAGKKKSRRDKRVAKAAKLAPRPTDRLRPVVHCPTIKYNRRVRAGRGFSLAELKAAGIPRKYAPTIGISVEPLQEYTKRVVVFPRRSGKTKQGDSSAEDVKKAREGGPVAPLKGSFLPIKNVVKIEEVKAGREKRKKAKEEEEQAKKK